MWCVFFVCFVCCLTRAHALPAGIEHTRPEVPNWTSPHVAVTLVFFPVTQTMFLSTTVFLIRRRHLYPIAGRGPTLLLLQTIVLWFLSSWTAIASMVYGTGFPCGMYAIAVWNTTPYVICMLLRGYVLVWRVEILNCLQELSWRQRKTTDTLEAAAAHNQIAPQANGGNSSSNGGGSGGSGTGPIDVSTLPGYFYLSHRRWMSSWYLAAMGAAVVTFMIVFTAVVYASDTDIASANVLRAEHGLPPDTLTNHFTGGAFFVAPVCIVGKSMKILYFDIFQAVCIPMTLWIGYRLWQNGKKLTARASEQGESTVRGSLTTDELDDLGKLKNELVLVCVMAVIFTATTGLLVLFMGATWLPFWISLIAFSLFCISIVAPVSHSFTIATKQRETRRYRGRASTSAPGNKRVVEPHREPLYQLHHILHNETCYPVLLAFLQREFSSENAMFYHEATAFGAFCRETERMIPGWASDMVSSDLQNIDPPSSAATITSNQRRPSSPSWSSFSIHEANTRATKSRTWCLDLYDKYIKKSALYEINIDGAINHTLVSHYAQLNEWHPCPGEEDPVAEFPTPPPVALSSVFLPALQCVFQLMQTDSFHRFVLTPGFETLLLAADEAESNRPYHQANANQLATDLLQQADLLLPLAR